VGVTSLHLSQGHLTYFPSTFFFLFIPCFGFLGVLLSFVIIKVHSNTWVSICQYVEPNKI